jgi:hypothetical protein
MSSPEALSVTLFLPGLGFDPAQPWSSGLSGLPSLHRLLARAQATQRSAEHFPALLLSHFGVQRQSDWPAAPFSLLADGGEPAGAFWLRADPVHLLTQQGQLVLAHTQLSAQESAWLAESVASHLAADGLTLLAPRPQRWYLRSPRELRLHTTPADLAAGRSVDALLPAGCDALLAHRWSTEIQMLLHEHPANAAREARGEPPVNSVWLWGAGRLTRPSADPTRHVWADDALVRGLALASQSMLHSQPQSAEAWLEAAQPGEHWIIIELGGRPQIWRAQGQQLERAWFAPLLAALAARRVREVALAILSGGQALRFRVACGDLWKLWRRSVSFSRG